MSIDRKRQTVSHEGAHRVIHRQANREPNGQRPADIKIPRDQRGSKGGQTEKRKKRSGDENMRLNDSINRRGR